MQDGEAAFSLEGEQGGEGFVEEDAEAPEVGACVELFAERLFRRHVARSSHDAVGVGEGEGGIGGQRREQPGEAEVEDLDLAAGGDHDVAGFEVAMHHSLLMGLFESLGHLHGNRSGFAGRQRSRAQFGGQGIAGDQLHDDVVGAVVLDDVVNGGDLGVIEPGEHARFAAEALAGFLVGEHAGLEHFDGDIALEFFVARAVDDAHAAGAELGDDAVAVEQARLGGEGRDGRRDRQRRL